MGARKWSDEEIAIARDILASGKTVKAMAHLLPDRPIGGIKCMVTKLAGDDKKKRGDTQWLWPAIERELKQNPGQTIEELRIKFNCSHKHACDVIRSRHGSCIYVSDWKTYIGHHIERWSLGSGPDAPKPPRQSIEERRRLGRLAYRMRTAKRNPFENMLMQLQGQIAKVGANDSGRVYIHLTDSPEEMEAAA